MVSNTILTPTAVTRRALLILHQKLNFIGNINRTYDDSYAKSGAKIGTDLKIRLPNQYTVRTGANLSTQNTTESSTTLTMATQKGVDIEFSSQELTLSIDDFAQRILEPAMAVLAANIEADAFNMYKDVYNMVGTAGTTPNALLTYLSARQKLNENLAPMDSNRAICLDPLSNAVIVDALKGLFHDGAAIKEQYREGIMGRTAGFDWYENTLVPTHTYGNKVSGVTINGGSQTGSTLNIGGVANADTFKQGTVITLAGCNRVHPETKADTGQLQQFVITADATMSGTTGSISISPAIATSGATQNVTASPTASGAVTIVSTPTASTAYGQNLAFHRDAFAFVSADLVMPQGVDFASRQVMDGLSMRIVRQYAISTDTFPCRIDILYGYKAIRPQMACRITR